MLLERKRPSPVFNYRETETKMNLPKLSPRLLAVAELVRGGSRVADVGTDHAYLPIYLCQSGKIRGAVASDINEGPVLRAKINIASYHLANKITVLRTDGLEKIDEYSPDDIMICGMGGELIARIISDAEWLKKEKIRLILQPMTQADKLRAYLLREGFSIIEERLVKEDKVYQIICAEYTGETDEYSETELIFGRKNLESRPAPLAEYAAFVRSVYLTKLEGKRISGADVSHEEEILAEIEKIICGA